MADNGHGNPAKRRRLFENIDEQDLPYNDPDHLNYTGSHLTSPQVGIQTGVLQKLTRQSTGDSNVYPTWLGNSYQQTVQERYIDPRDTILGNTHQSPADASMSTGTSTRPHDVPAQPSYSSGPVSYTTRAIPVPTVQHHLEYESSAVPSTPELPHRLPRVPAADTLELYMQRPSQPFDITAMSATQSSRGRQPSNTPRSSTRQSRYCDECPEEFETAKELERHKIKEHCEKVPCDLCGKLLKPRSDNYTRHLKVCKGVPRLQSNAAGTSVGGTNDEASAWSMVDFPASGPDVNQQVASGQSSRRESKMPMRPRNNDNNTNNNFDGQPSYQQSLMDYETLYPQQTSSVPTDQASSSRYQPSSFDRVNMRGGSAYPVSHRSAYPTASSYASSDLRSIAEEPVPSYGQGRYLDPYQPDPTRTSSSRSTSNDHMRTSLSPWDQAPAQSRSQRPLSQNTLPSGATATNMYGSASAGILHTIGSATSGVNQAQSVANTYPVEGATTRQSLPRHSREALPSYNANVPSTASLYNTSNIDDLDLDLDQLSQSNSDFAQYGYNPQQRSYDSQYPG